jgi:C-terminal processing protease CtpA/Prc
MHLVDGRDAIILDRRRNGGGSGETATALLSYFFEEPQMLSSNFRTSQWSHAGAAKMDNALPCRAIGRPIYILTRSQHTHAAAELCAYDLKSMRRATIVGAKTAGDANSSMGVVALGYGRTALIPNGQTRSPITHTNWEGSGLQPDVTVNPDDSLLADYQGSCGIEAASHEFGRSFAGTFEGFAKILTPL